MNAAEQAIGVEQATKIAAMVNLFKAEFPDARSDLKPWANDPDTRELVDPDSIDIGFHLPGWSRRFQCRSILMQIRFFQDLDLEDLDLEDLELEDVNPSSPAKPQLDRRRAIGIEAVGFTHMGEQWHLSTIDHWQFIGEAIPTEEIQEKLKLVCRQIFELFNGKDE